MATRTKAKKPVKGGTTALPYNRLKFFDALVLFGASRDLVHKKIFPALYAMAKRGALRVPVFGLATSKLTPAQLRERVESGIRQSGKIDDPAALRHLLSLLNYIDGDYNDPQTFDRPRQALGNARRPTHYLAIPPSLFATVIRGLGAAGLAQAAVEAAWAVVDPVLRRHASVLPYRRGSWGPKAADALLGAGAHWFNPRFDDAAAD